MTLWNGIDKMFRRKCSQHVDEVFADSFSLASAAYRYDDNQ